MDIWAHTEDIRKDKYAINKFQCILKWAAWKSQNHETLETLGNSMEKKSYHPPIPTLSLYYFALCLVSRGLAVPK